MKKLIESSWWNLNMNYHTVSYMHRWQNMVFCSRKCDADENVWESIFNERTDVWTICYCESLNALFENVKQETIIIDISIFSQIILNPPFSVISNEKPHQQSICQKKNSKSKLDSLDRQLYICKHFAFWIRPKYDEKYFEENMNKKKPIL